MESLSAQIFGCKTSVLDIRDVGGKWEFLNCLARGDLLLVPYDPDKNYVPVLKKGHKAHWALVTGELLTLSHTVPTLSDLGKKPFENVMGKGENADNHQTAQIIQADLSSLFTSLL